MQTFHDLCSNVPVVSEAVVPVLQHGIRFATQLLNLTKHVIYLMAHQLIGVEADNGFCPVVIVYIDEME